MTIYRDGAKPARVDLTKLFSAASDRHVEIMRDDLSEIYYDAGRDDVEYLFAESITGISPDGEVTFERATPRGFDVVVGADGLHSNVRRLVFGDEAELTRFLGDYLAVASVPKSFAPEGEMLCYAGVGRMSAIYTAHHLDDARMGFFSTAPNCSMTTEIRCGKKSYCVGLSPGWLPRWTAGWVNSTTRRRFTSMPSLSLSWTAGRAGG